MILDYIHSDNSKESIELDLDIKPTNAWININTKNKLDFIKEFLPAFSSGQKVILFDSNHKELLKFYEQNNINEFELMDEVNKDSKLLFFTSGSSGFPVGAFKSKDNLEKEIVVLKELVQKYKIKKVVVTVPFVHIYGVLAGLLLPLSLRDVTLVVKEDFLPYEVLKEANEPNTLVVTTPVFIKSLAKLSDERVLKSNLFISSTGPLHVDDIKLFRDKYKADLIQIFGSTETGGIAYKLNDSIKWLPLSLVKVETKDERLSVSSPFISPFILNKQISKLEQPFITEDIIEIDEDKFTLIGRSNKIIKIAGKRISALQIESIVESIEGVQKAIVELVYKKELLRSEQILITIEAKQAIDKKIIKKKINESFGVLTIPFNVVYTQSINYSAMGKKIIF